MVTRQPNKPKFIIKPAGEKQWVGKVISGNGIILHTTEVKSSKAAVENNFESLRVAFELLARKIVKITVE